ncbi:MAG: ATP-binding protein [Peptococcaceae bacterium]|nr:ATP-binding protein [Peptococcaceae bacterium]
MIPGFPVGTIVPGSDLVGREDIIRSLVNRLQRGENLILASPRRTGKTSVAMEILARLQAGGTMTVYLDFFRYAAPEGFALAFTSEVLKNDRILARGLRWVAQQLPVLSEIKTDFGEAVSLAVELQQKRQLSLDAVLDLGEALARRRQRHLVVVLDEFQDAGKFGADVYRTFRSFFQHHQNSTYLFLGSRKGLLEALFIRENEPFFRFASLEALPPVPALVWEGYLRRKLQLAGVTVNKNFARHMAEAAGGHPGDLMHLGNAVMDVWNGELDTGTLLDAAYQLTMSRLTPTFGEMWRLLASHPGAQVVARRVATGDPLYGKSGRKPSSFQVTRAVHFLAEEGILEKVARGHYAFGEKMFADYIRDLEH